MALFVIKIYAESPEVVETQLKQNLELCTGNADPFIVLFMIYQSVANGEKANEMLELARKVEPNNQYIEYHEIASKFLRTTQAQDMLGLHNLTAEIDRRFHDTTDIPEFAILTAARVCFYRTDALSIFSDLSHRTKHPIEYGIVKQIQRNAQRN
jgi:hypothetical protein